MQSRLRGKMTKAPFIGVSERALDPLGLIKLGVCGPLEQRIETVKESSLHLLMTSLHLDMCTPMKQKHEAFDVLKVFQSEVHNQLGKKV